MKTISIKKKCFILINLFFTSLVYSQSGGVKGVIIDKETKQPVEDVVITIEKNNDHTHSDAAGAYSFVSLTPGTYEIGYNKFGYESQKLNVTITKNKAEELNVEFIFNAKTLKVIDIETDRAISAASSTYLSKVDFENRPKNSAQDMLRLVPGLFIAQHAGGGKSEQIFIRGFDCDHGTDIATFVDGIPVNMPSHGHGQGYADLHFLIPEVVEGMEIFKGASSPLYGDFATAAAVNFKTMDTLQNNLIQLESGSVLPTKAITSNRALALLQIPLRNKNVSSYFAADLINNRGFFDKSQDFKRMNIFSKTIIELNENSNLQFSISGFGSSWNASGQIPERAVSKDLITRFGSIDPNEGGTTQRNNYNLTYINKTDKGQFETQAYMCSYNFKLFSNFTFFLTDPVNGDMIEQDDNRIVRGLNTKYSKDHTLFNMNNKFTIGASFRADDIENQLWHAPNRTRLKASAHSMIHERSSAVYINETFHFNDHFRAEAGLRYDYFIFNVDDLLHTDSIHKNYSGFNYQHALNPKLNLIYSINNKIQLFFNSGSGYHSNDSRSSVQDKQHRLPIAVSTELGALCHAGRSVLSAAAWAMDLSNELVYVGDDGTTENRGASRRIGADMSGRAQLFSWLYVDVDFNLSKGRFIDTLFGTLVKTDHYIPLAPVITSAGGLTLKINKKIECGLRYRYMGNRPGNESNSITAHGYNVFDLTANYRTKSYKVGLVVENLLNVNWNEAQFVTETRMQNEPAPVNEIHFTPGTPFYLKLSVGYLF